MCFYTEAFVKAIYSIGSGGSCSGRYKSGITMIYDLIFNARHDIFVRIVRKQWNCKLQNSPVAFRKPVYVPVCYNRNYYY